MITTHSNVEPQMLLMSAYQDFEKRLKMHAFFKVHDAAMSEDLVQDTFMKAWAYLLRGGKIDVMKAFLYHILNNLIIDEYRRHHTLSLDQILEKGYEPGMNHCDRLFDELDGREAMRSIDTLPPMYRKVLRMRYVDNLTLPEMASKTGQSKNTTAVQLHRGLAKLKEVYTHSSANVV
ncbi:MAG: polymerase ECF-type sigma factor, polymerase sigma-70 factor, subfamily [Parcubacteria group bacterium]|nr:polymerase ECF-type sigma factor, polymerase sigma-70 factor, subfamily [Parcubacteria group bacterium]